MASAPCETRARRLTFRVGTRRFALPIVAVREVARRPALTRVPLAPDSLAGLANLRGTVLPIVSLAALVGEPADDAGWVIVLERADPFGLLIDHVAALGTGDTEAPLLDADALLLAAFGEARPIDRTMRVGLVANDTQESQAERIALLGFLVGTQEFALPLEQIDEVVRLPDDVTPLPHSDAAVVGTIARHGRLLPLLALARLLGLPPSAGGARQRIVVARIGAHRVGLVVDAVSTILRVDPAAIDPIPAALARGNGEASIQAICRLGGQRLVSVLAADHLLRTDLPHAPQTPEDIEATREDRTHGDQFLLFRLGAQQFALPIAVVGEITVLPDTLTPLPRAPAFVKGVMNLRGQIVPVIDQGRRFLGNPAGGRRRRVVVVAIDGASTGFVVDEVSEVLRIPRDAVRPAPDLGPHTRVFDRIATPDGAERMILIISPGELLGGTERDLLAAMTAGVPPAP